MWWHSGTESDSESRGPGFDPVFLSLSKALTPYSSG